MRSLDCWTSADQRTNPTRIHRFTPDGKPAAVVIEILKEGGSDGVAKDAVEFRVVAAPPDPPSACLAHLPPDWQDQDWSTQDRVPKGLLYVWPHEYEDPHSVLAAAERKRQAAGPPDEGLSTGDTQSEEGQETNG